MQCDRRLFLRNITLAVLASQLPLQVKANSQPNSVIKPSRLKAGDTVGLISPASPINAADIDPVVQTLASLGLKAKLGKHILDRYGDIAGKDSDRAADVNQMFADTSVSAILPMRGGWGCNRILPLLDYDLIRQHPKIIIGYSDITSLLIAIYARCGFVTFHGPVGTSTWNSFSVDYFKRIIFDSKAVTLQNPIIANNLNSTTIKVETITPGKARGRLIGGNLSVLTAMMGSAYLPSWQQKILFLEEVGEDIYRVDRMLTQLKLAGILQQISGFIFGQCTNCSPGKDNQSLPLQEVLLNHIQPLHIPAWYGSMIGHIKDKFTLPVGVLVEINANTGTIQMLESAVS
ncbi:peptidase U61 LD-carboxypeptidase A [Crinalium epipsammum PCC 9333]|uniref:Peptidase U61 LD-carboxypeptidase A n=1 Tax=Crinalium epipsammum PCC 9333 TaxID=1173022 RepID=K9W3F7_9CYAN|nr:LD-carboxypeptidase [Crinalium epipsammum]AFZ14329.1 peptidase U61 LD-carboxypeptidase A [Crinalium epipsammum PCC 9333]